MSFYKSSSIQKLKEENEKLKKDIEVLVATLEKDNEKLSKNIIELKGEKVELVNKYQKFKNKMKKLMVFSDSDDENVLNNDIPERTHHKQTIRRRRPLSDQNICND